MASVAKTSTLRAMADAYLALLETLYLMAIPVSTMDSENAFRTIPGAKF
jgi:hypothetical protein